MTKLPTLSAISSNPLAKRAAGELRKGHRQLTSRAIETVLLEGKAGKEARLSLPRKLVGMALMRVATRSVPGALVVGGALLAKHLHDRKKAHDAARRESDSESPLLAPELKRPAPKKS